MVDEVCREPHFGGGLWLSCSLFLFSSSSSCLYSDDVYKSSIVLISLRWRCPQQVGKIANRSQVAKFGISQVCSIGKLSSRPKRVAGVVVQV